MSEFVRDMEEVDRLLRKYGLINITLFAKINKISRPTVYTMLKDGRLNSVRVGGVRFVSSFNRKKLVRNGRKKEFIADKVA